MDRDDGREHPEHPRYPKIKSDPNIKEPDIEYETLFARDRYVECTGATASPPDANC